MTNPSSRNGKIPGIHITELDAFPPSVAGVPTAVPAFIGYTETAELNGDTVSNQTVKISSLSQYESIFGKGCKPVFNISTYGPGDNPDFEAFNPENGETTGYLITQSPASAFNLYDSIRLFYNNGGGDCYIISVGGYNDGAAIIKAALLTGLEVARNEPEITMLVVPDAVLLPGTGDETRPWISSDFAGIARAMLKQCGDLRDRVALLDIYGSGHATGDNLDTIAEQFRKDVGDQHLSYGIAYFPFLATSVAEFHEFNYSNISDYADPNMEPGIIRILKMQNMASNSEDKGGSRVLNSRGDNIDADIELIATTTGREEIKNLNAKLASELPLLADIVTTMSGKYGVLPCSGIMAGVYTHVDFTQGVWNPPANITPVAVNAVTFKVNDRQQEDLNRPVNGKAINAIREFQGRGPVVWGARTLDGNSNDWRYIQNRRTIIYIEQSIKRALDTFIFDANDAKTWFRVKSMISAFLHGLWGQGGLMGDIAQNAYSVEVGLGSTMMERDILEGYMIVQVTVQIFRPAEFIELAFKQKMEGTA